MDARQVWQAALERIRERVSQGAYTTWFHGASGVALNGRTLTVSVSNTFAAEHLARRFEDIARAAVSQVLCVPAEVRFEVSSPSSRASQDERPASPPRARRGASPRPERAQSAPAVAMPRIAPAARGGVERAELHVTQPPLLGLSRAPGSGPLRTPLPAISATRAPASGPLRSGSRPPNEQDADANPRFTFETFVVGPGNRFAYAASQEIARAPGERYNPLLIWGGVGLGKTHLLYAIGRQLTARGQRVAYVTAEQFTNEIVEAIRRHATPSFRERYRTVDALLVDDVHFIAGRDSTEEEFFHTFNWLHEANKQIVLTSDRPPRAMPQLHDRLRSRFEWGLMVDIQPPTFEERLAILRAKAIELEIEAPDDALEQVARPECESIRELEGELKRVAVWARTMGAPLDAQTVARALGPMRQERQASRPVDAAAVLATVSSRFAVSTEALLGKSRERQVAWARQVAMYLMREETDASLFQIGAQLGGRDHTTIMHGCAAVTKRIADDARARADVTAAQAALRSGHGERE
ncbi:MAG TPA: chromosomal replication initiator protein DnaA [Ktedonobacterales bacterium]|nr:chromosomal replication initiator protein DnaA [Ktedonobacterales bacterium]